MIWNRNSLLEQEDQILLNVPSGKYIDSFLKEFDSFVIEIKKRILEGLGFCIVRGIDFENLDEDSCKELIVRICNLIGNPTITDKLTKSIVWPIQYKESPGMDNITYSQHSDEADLHTDTQYFENPERVMSLWCMNHDSNGEGVSILADGAYIKDRLIQLEGGCKFLETLSSTKFPFRVPSVFTSTASDKSVEFFSAPIFSNNPFMRYRKETILKGLEVSRVSLTTDQLEALNALESILSRDDISFNYLLRKGEVLFVNNHRILHGRTSFNDRNRLLYRVRIDIN